MKNNIKKFLIINFGLIILCLGLHLFLIPANLAAGGVSGIGMIVKSYFPKMNIGILMLILNFILFIIAYIIIGREFTGYTIYASFFISGFLGILEKLLPIKNMFPEDLLINLIFGIVIQAIGLAVVFYQDASTGGTDIIAKIINKFTHIDLGKSLLLADFLIVIFAGIAFNPRLGMYAFLGVVLTGAVVDKAIAGFSTKVQIKIISNNNDEIINFIDSKLERGATFLKGYGAYSHDEKEIISVVLPRREYLMLRRHIKEVDPNAFITVSYVHEVIGEGFTY